MLANRFIIPQPSERSPERLAPARRLRLAFGLATAIAASVSTAAVAGPPATGPEAFVYADQPTTAFYTPNLDYNYNQVKFFTLNGPDNTVTRFSVGAYGVDLPKLAAFGGNVQVTAVNTVGGYCKVGSWAPLFPSYVDLRIQVRCFDKDGIAADSKFTVSYFRYTASSGGNDPDLAYVWANAPSLPNYQPWLTYQFNSRGTINTITRYGIGRYLVKLTGMTQFGGTASVTAYGSGNERCKITGVAGFGAEGIGVWCHTPSGDPVDTPFTLAYSRNTGFTQAFGCERFAAAYTYYTPQLSWIPPPGLKYGSNGAPTAGRLFTGIYSVAVPGLITKDKTIPLVTAIGGSAGYCSLITWSTLTDTDPFIYVVCVAAGTGALLDSQFMIQWQTTTGIVC